MYFKFCFIQLKHLNVHNFMFNNFAVYFKRLNLNIKHESNIAMIKVYDYSLICLILINNNLTLMLD